MVYEYDRDKFRALLWSKKTQLLDYRSDWEESLETLQEKEPELEETAQKEILSRDLESLDEQSLAVVEAIDRALRKLESGSYGVCDLCGETIPDGRLEAIPWTSWCKDCAARVEKEGEPVQEELEQAYEGGRVSLRPTSTGGR
jgi:DnaK suppressor protein